LGITSTYKIIRKGLNLDWYRMLLNIKIQFYLYLNYQKTRMRKRYHIAFLTSIDPKNKLKLSGSPYYIMNALQKYVGDVTNLGPIEFNKFIFTHFERATKLLPRPYNLNHSFIHAYFFAKVFQSKLRHKKFDVIFAPRASTQIALLKTDIPIVYYSDTTFKSMYNYYSWFSNFLKISEREGNNIEQKAIRKSKRVILSSQWAADSVINDYNTPKEKVHVVPFGPNVDYIPTKEELLDRKPIGICKLLFIGVEWERKGGQIAVDTLLELKKMGVKASLTIVGVIPPEPMITEDVVVIPYLDKNNKADSNKFNELLLESHFLILPTREECFGVVFCEASAFGLPSLSTDTGGVPTAVIDNKNGFLFKLSDGGKEYANKIVKYFTDYDNLYSKLSESSRKYYEDTLNWKSFGLAIYEIIDDMLSEINNPNP